MWIVSLIFLGSLAQQASQISMMNGRIIMDSSDLAVVTAEVNLRNDKDQMICKLDKGTIVEVGENHAEKENRVWVTARTGNAVDKDGHILKNGLLRLTPLESKEKVKIKQYIEVYDRDGKCIAKLPEGSKVTVLGFSKQDADMVVILFVDESNDSANNVGCVHKSVVNIK